MQLHNVSEGKYLVNKYALLLDFRTIDENELHGMCRQIGNTSGGSTIQVKKKVESDALLNVQSGAFKDQATKMFMKEPHTVLFVAPMGVGKMHLALSLLENEYRNHFDFIVIICHTLAHNETYKI